MRAYTVAAAAVTLRVSMKWVDNTLSHYKLQGVGQYRQGIPRRVTAEAILVLEIALRVARALAVPMHRSLEIAEALAKAGKGSVPLPGDISISIDLAGVQADLVGRLAHAVEVAPSPRRGRPPKQALR